MTEFEATMPVKLEWVWVQWGTSVVALYHLRARLGYCQLLPCGRWQNWTGDGKTAGRLFDSLEDCQRDLEQALGIVRVES